ncbi:MAG: ABC transporter substrate-binding protein [Sphaerochaetaceae bacterium]|jgi:iron(III) transport system substrate-binding protein
MKKSLVVLFVFLIACSMVFAGGEKEGASGASGEKLKLMVYTSMKENLIGSIRDAFLTEHPEVEFDYYSAGAGKLMAKIATERQAGAIACDVLWTSEVPDFIGLRNEGVLLAYKSPEREHVISTIDDPDGYFTAARLGTLGICYNTEKIKDPPKTWDDLLKPEYKNNFSIANPALSGTSMVSVAMIVENLGWEYIQKLADNGTRMGQGSGQVVDDTAAGDTYAAIGVDYITLDKIAKGANLGFTYTDRMLVIPSPVAIMAGTQNEKAAKLFVDFLLSKKGQECVAAAYTLPIREDVEPRMDMGLVHPDEARSRAMALDYVALADHKAEYIEKFTSIIQGK